MKTKFYFLASFALLLLIVSCCTSTDELLTSGKKSTARVFTASMERGTRTELNGSDLVWQTGDLISVFAGYDANLKYILDEGAGTGIGTFVAAETPYTSVNELPANYALYPWNDGTAMLKVSDSWVISMTYPAVQSYAGNWFAPGLWQMAAVTSGTADTEFNFKTISSGIRFSLTGEATIKSIIFRGNSNEPVSGSFMVQPIYRADPQVVPSTSASRTVRLDCGAGVALSTSEATDFYIALPPVTFNSGFTVCFRDDAGNEMTVSTSEALAIERNHVAATTSKVFSGTPAQIPDPGFFGAIIESFDTNGDFILSNAEANSVRTIDINTDGISSLEGIALFRNLNTLKATGSKSAGTRASDEVSGGLTEVDFSQNRFLSSVNLDNNHLSSIILGSQPWLQTFSCANNQLTELDVSGCPNLSNFNCSGNNIVSLDISDNYKLYSVNVSDNPGVNVTLAEGQSYYLSIINNGISLTEVFKLDFLPQWVEKIYQKMTAQYQKFSQGFGGEGAVRLLYGELAGESLAVPNATFTNPFVDHSALTHQGSHNLYYPLAYYHTVINHVLSLIHKYDNAAVAGQTTADSDFYKAQMLTLKSYCYLMLAQIYAGAWPEAASQPCFPYRNIPVWALTPKNTLSEVFNYIYSDLDEAITLFNHSTLSRSDAHIADKSVAYAIYAKASLVQKNYQQALEYAQMAENGFPLMSNSEYTSGFKLANAEWIWGAQPGAATTELNIYYWSFYAYMGYNSNSSRIRTCPARISRTLFDKIPSTDIRKSLFLDPLEYPYNTDSGLADTELTGYGREYAAKDGRVGLYSTSRVYAWMQFKFACTITPGMGQLPYIRASEMVLIEAEANYFLGNESAARDRLEYLNRTSGRDPSYSCSKTGADLFEEIKTYRAIELWGEGSNFFDIKRWGDNIVRSSFADGGSFIAAHAGSWSPAQKNNYTYDLPTDETVYSNCILAFQEK